MALATADFLANYLPSGRKAATLVRVNLGYDAELGADRMLYLCDHEVNTCTNLNTDRTHWQDALEHIGDVVEDGSLGETDPRLSTFDFVLSNRPLDGQAETDSALQLFVDFTWYGATVEVFYWEEGMTNFSSALQIFEGVVIEYELGEARAHVFCQQDGGWIQRVPDTVVTRGKYPRAPEKSIGAVIPVCYGDLRGTPARSPAAAHDAFNQGINSTFGMRRPGTRGVVVSAGQGGSGKDGRVLFAAHACKLFNDDTQGATPGVLVAGVLCELDPASGKDFNAASGTGFDFSDISSADVQPFDVFYPVPPSDSKAAASNNAENSRAATDGFNDTSFTVLDYDGGQREAVFMLPDVAPVGRVIDIKLVVGWLGSSLPATSPPGLDAKFVGVGGSHVPFFLTNSTTPTAQGQSITSTYWPTDGWSFAKQGCYIQLKFSGVATGALARIFYVGLSIKTRPAWPVVSRAYVVPGYVTDYRMVSTLKGQHRHWYQRRDPRLDVYVPEVNRVDSTDFFAALQGYADDGSGTDTGTASALIQRPPDIVRHFLREHCGETLFETGVGEPGSLVDLRDALKTWRGDDMKVAFALDAAQQSSAVLREIAESSACWFFKSNITGKWCGIPWTAARAVEFPRTLTRYDVMEPGGPQVIMHRDGVRQDLSLRFGHDAYARRTVHEAFLGPGRSQAGHSLRNLRFGNLEVVASESDRIDFYDGTTRSASLTVGAYTGIDLAEHASTQMSGVSGSGKTKWAYGFVIKASFNDRVYFNDGSAKQVTLTPGEYLTGALLAAEVQAQLNASSSNWTCTYSTSTRKFTISRSSGTAQLYWSTGYSGTTARSAAVTLGFVHGTDLAFGPHTSAFEVEPYRFAVCDFTNALKLLWETGAAGIDAGTPRPSGELFGFDMARDFNREYASATRYCVAHAPKFDLESRADASMATFGWRPPYEGDLKCVNDTDTALEVLRRVFALTENAPVEIRFTTERMPDLQRGMTFDFDSSVDEVKPFPVPWTDGSWASKVFVATHVKKRSSPHGQFVIGFLVPDAL